ncbi:MAG: ATP-binding cassette domain-containing protein, partial [Candidatus Pacebacteria bacterium]|nr:ATP-binding cassette domain-containing protein [Candidatus Paceibacterota bacterium]
IKWSYDNLWHVAVHFIGFFTNMIQQKQDAQVVKEQFSQILPPPAQNQQPFPQDWQEIELKNLALEFTNPKGKNVDIRVPQLKLKKGEKVGVIGESGAGKSTILSTLLNLTDYQGEYLVDGQSARNFQVSNEVMMLINNFDPLFNLSVKENIELGRDIKSAKLKLLLEKLQINKFFPDLKAVIGDKNTYFSSGQLQRLRLLRGLVAKSQIYLLDEPFNGIDKENKVKIIKFLKRYLKDQTVVLVTHDKAELSLVDRVYEFQGSRLVKQG